jgi:hypothetical protein
MDPGEAVRLFQVVLSGAQTPAGAAWSTLRTQEDCLLHFRKARPGKSRLNGLPAARPIEGSQAKAKALFLTRHSSPRSLASSTGNQGEEAAAGNGRGLKKHEKPEPPLSGGSGRNFGIRGELPARFAPASAAIAATVAAAAATAAERPLLARAGFVDIDLAAAEIGAVQRIDGALGFLVIRHFDEGEAAAAARVAVGDDAHPVNGPVILKQPPNGFLARVETQVSNENILHF